MYMSALTGNVYAIIYSKRLLGQPETGPQGYGSEVIQKHLKTASAKVRNVPVDTIQIGRHPYGQN
jgi:hypothetical protein